MIGDPPGLLDAVKTLEDQLGEVEVAGTASVVEREKHAPDRVGGPARDVDPGDLGTCCLPSLLVSLIALCVGGMLDGLANSLWLVLGVALLSAAAMLLLPKDALRAPVTSGPAADNACGSSCMQPAVAEAS
ncbi:MAG: hypothetical protein GEU28_13970 [Dehalococcoidia bacterium]|nr:hypothetical protein [Dehalococcoidia bacterium]